MYSIHYRDHLEKLKSLQETKSLLKAEKLNGEKFLSIMSKGFNLDVVMSTKSKYVFNLQFEIFKGTCDI